MTFSLPRVRHPNYWTRQFAGEAVKARQDPFSSFDYVEYDSSDIACDQCRKSKCKCERSSANEPCKACIMLGTRKFYIIQFVAIYSTSSFFNRSLPERNMRLVLPANYLAALKLNTITLYNLVFLSSSGLTDLCLLYLNIPRLHVSWSVAQTRSPKRLYRCHRSPLASN